MAKDIKMKKGNDEITISEDFFGALQKIRLQN